MRRSRTVLFVCSLTTLAALSCGPPEEKDDPIEARQGAVTAVLFQPYVKYPVGSWPEVVAIGDLNGDGRKDIALTTSFYLDPPNDNTLHVFLQASDGSLLPRVTYPLGTRPQSIDIGDVNGDGRADVVVGNVDSATIGVLLQNASGTLDPMLTYPTINSYSIKIGDFNSDGRMDVVGINWGSSGDAVDIFLQTTDGALAPPVTYHVVHDGYDEVDVGDVDGDGRTDVVVMNGQGYAFPNIGVLPQNADGTMGTPVYYSVGGDVLTGGVAVGDCNGDGLSDLVVSYGGNRPRSFIARFLQNEQHTLDPAESFTSYDIPTPVVLADVDGDGRADVLTAHSGWGRLGVYRQAPDGGLGAEELYPITSASWFRPQGLAVGDINGDTLPDVVIADSGAGLVVLRHVDDAPPVVTITAPLGGAFLTGSPLALAWDAHDNAALAGFDVAVSLDGGVSYAPVPGCTGLAAGARACAWTTPAAAGPARLRVTARDGAGNQAQAETIVDVVAPVVTVTAPVAAATLVSGSPAAITWSSNLSAAETMTIALSLDGGASFATLASAAPNTGTFAWIVTGPSSDAALVRVTWNGGTAAGLSGLFAITVPTISVTAPELGESWTIGTVRSITWTSDISAAETVRIELSRNGGRRYSTLAAAAPNTGTFAWTVAGGATSNALVRISWAGGSAVDVSKPFALVAAAVTVTSPGSDIWFAGTSQEIAWTHNLGADALFLIELSRDKGVTWNPIASDVPSGDATSGGYLWDVTGPRATAKVRVSWTNNTGVSDKSVNFKIR